MKWFAVIVFEVLSGGNYSMVPVASQAECLALIKSAGENTALDYRAAQNVLTHSFCTAIPEVTP